MADENTVDDIPLFDPSMKKKKKKKKVVEEESTADQSTPSTDSTSQSAPDSTADGASNESADSGATENDDNDEDSLNFGKAKKKKKKTKKPLDDETDENAVSAAAASSSDASSSSADGSAVATWEGTDRDYNYDELLSRVFNILDQNNPDLSRSKRSRMMMKPPSVFREGTKKTVWANFQEICKLMHRNTEHVMAFSLAELGTNGSVDGSYRLVIKGRFNPKQIESVIKHYITEYVTCRTCKSYETNLKKENRLYFVQCQSCGSTRSVLPIKTGYQAQVGKRKKV